MKHKLLRDSIKKELEAKYELRHFSLSIKGRAYQLASISNIDRVMDDIAEEDEGNNNPYWAELWHAAIGLAEMIEEGGVVRPGQQVLEIGCGMGLCGIAAAFQGAEVVLTDHVPEALQLARYNWLLNHDSLPDCRLLDWREPKPDWKTECLIASDVAYEAEAYIPLVNFFKAMTRENGEIWLSEPGRSYTQSWVSKLTDHGFFMKKFTYFVSYQELETHVGVYQLKKPGLNP